MKKIVSLYSTSGEIAGTSYYRIYQYFDNDQYNIRKCPRLTNSMYKNWMPISYKNIFFKGFIFFLIYFRTLGFFLRDCISRPHKLVISRSFLPRFLPLSYKLLVKYLKWKGTDFIWDFDDDIISTGEFRRVDFDWFSKIPKYIVVASENNLKMVKSKYRTKCKVLSTTDKDMYRLFSDDLINNRIKELKYKQNLIWVGTAVSLPFLIKVMPYLEEYAENQKSGNIKVSLTVVCNKPLDYVPKNFELNNIKWTRSDAIKHMKNSHLGIMPLPDTAITQGKGGFKLIQYLSIGLPIIGSPIGINDKIISKEVGFKAKIDNRNAWIVGFEKILRDPILYKEYCINAYNRWATEYSYSRNLEIWSQMIDS